jgi:hypothetical protein
VCHCPGVAAALVGDERASVLDLREGIVSEKTEADEDEKCVEVDAHRTDCECSLFLCCLVG